MNVLDPGPAAAAGARHGQLASGLPGGGLALSCQKLVEDGARVMMLLAPGLFRLDVRPSEDTLQVMTRSLQEGARWGTSRRRRPTTAARPTRRRSPRGPTSRSSRSSTTTGRPGPRPAPLTIDRERGVTHFVAQAILREVEPSMVWLRPPG